jgi:hypothetical protein
VKLLSMSHSKNATASAISASGTGGGLDLSSAITSLTRASIARQSCTQTRISASTRSMTSTISARRASSSMRSTWR